MMGRIVFGSPEAKAILERDKKLREEEERKARLQKWEVPVYFDGSVTVTVIAEDKEAAREEAIFLATTDYFEKIVVTTGRVTCKGKAST